MVPNEGLQIKEDEASDEMNLSCPTRAPLEHSSKNAPIQTEVQEES